MTYQFFDGDVSPGATYYYKLERLHGEGPPEYSEARSVTLQPVGEPPVADAGPDRMVILTEGAEREPVLLDASGFFDPDGTIVEYGWYKSGGG